MAKQKPRNLREALKGKLSKKEMEALITSFDSLGNIAVIQIPKKIEGRAKLIGETLLGLNRQFETVCMVKGEHQGRYRVQPVKVIAGKRNKRATYRESGCVFHIHLGKVFFSPRLATERRRIAGLVKKGEVIGAFFAGVGPFPIVFAKLTKMEKAYAIELNPEAYKELIHNISLNRCQNRVEAIKGDVKKAVPKKLLGKCDRVVMPLPKGGENFLKEAMLALKPKGGTIHFYRLIEKQNPQQPLKEIRETGKRLGFKTRITRNKKVRSFSASKEQIVIDFKAKSQNP